MNRIDFTSFNCDFMLYSDMTNAEVAIYAPLIYGFEDKYFNACVEYIRTGKMTNIQFRKYSTEILQSSMEVSYIQALVILHNIESMPNEAPNIYNPNVEE
ncbi:MAG: hypothetical protein IJ400_04810 [Clostridia bacterium]|nr:hypothetical protein [Clostridia bacterium]